MRLLHISQPSATTGKLFQQRGISGVADSGVRMVPEAPLRRSSGNATGASILRWKSTPGVALSSVGTGSWKEGNRRVQAAPDGIAPENAEFGTGDSNTSNELSKQGKSGGVIREKDEAKEDPKAELTGELWGSKDDEGSTHAFLEDEKKVDFIGDEDVSVLGELGSWRRSYRKSN